MKVICTQENLRTGLQTASRIITSSNTLPVLNNLLLKTENGLLSISSTNLEISIRTQVRCKIETEGEVCIPAKTFTELIGTLPNNNITLLTDSGVLRVETENFKGSLKTLPAEEFPLIPEVAARSTIRFVSTELKKALEYVLFAASTNETQPEICGVFIAGTSDGIKMVATDRYRLAEIKLPVRISEGIDNIIIPLKTANEIDKILSGPETPVEIKIGDNQALFSIAETQIVSRLVDGQYPDYEQIIPETFDTNISVSRTSLLSALRTSGIFSYGTNTVRLEFLGSEQKIVVSSGSQDLGESTVSVPCSVVGPDVTVLFNYRYIQDVLSSLNEEEILVKVNTDNTPVVIGRSDNKDYLYLVMPIKI